MLSLRWPECLRLPSGVSSRKLKFLPFFLSVSIHLIAACKNEHTSVFKLKRTHKRFHSEQFQTCIQIESWAEISAVGIYDPTKGLYCPHFLLTSRVWYLQVFGALSTTYLIATAVTLNDSIYSFVYLTFWGGKNKTLLTLKRPWWLHRSFA